MAIVALCAVTVVAAWTDNARGEGSRSLYPTTYPAGGFRANLDFQPGQLYVGKVRRSGFLYVYARAGEYIVLGSRNRPVANGGDIFVYNPQDFGTPGNEIYNSLTPGVPEFRCTTGSTQPGVHFSGGTKGIISSRSQELAGPNSADNTVTVPGKFEPCAYQAPVTGIYGVLFTVATAGGAGPNGVIDPPGISNNSVSAWDVTVRADAASTTDIDGRLFTYAFIGFTGGNSRPVFSTHYYVTNDGYRYQQDLRGFDPNGYAVYANSLGFLDNGQPLYKDLRGNEALVTTLPPGVTTQTAQYPIFFSDVGPAGPNVAEVERVLTVLGIPLTPPSPTVSNVGFTGPFTGARTTTGAGGTFTFTTTDTITYMIIVSRDGVDFNPENTNNRVLTGIAPTGSHSIVWDGRDGSGLNFPSSTDAYPFRVFGRNGEVHFPIIDAENNPGGGPTITRLNGTNAGDRTVYFDDRGYRTNSGSLVGVLNGTLCPAATPAAPVPPVSLLGVDSVTNYRLWQSGNNANADCAATAGWGDAKGLNLWTYFSTAPGSNLLFIDPIIVDVATSVSAPNAAIAGSLVQGAFSFANNGTGTAQNVTYSMTMTSGLGVVTFGSLPVGATATYNNVTGNVTLTGLPTTLAAGESLPLMTFSYTAPGAGPVTVATGINTTSPEETFLANNNATASTGIGLTDVLTTVSVPAAALSGATVSGTFLFANFGADTAAGVTYSATIGSAGNFPPAVVFTRLPTGVSASYNAADGQVTFTGLPTTLASGRSFSFGFSYTAPASGIVPVSTSIATTSSDANVGNNSASGVTTITPLADVTTTVAPPAGASAGSTVNVPISFSNVGPSTATGVAYSATLPAGLGGVSCAGATCSYDSATGAVTISGLPGSLNSGQAVNMTLSYTAPGSGSVSVSSAIATSTTESNTGNNSAGGSTTIGVAAAGTVAGVVFNDLNGNGVQDPGDPGMSGVTVRLFDNLNNLVTTMTTDANGSYAFSNVPVGNYTVQEVTPAGYLNTTPTTVVVAVTSGETSTAVFGLQQSASAISVPTMNEYGMLILSVLAGLMAVFYLMKRRPTSASEV